MRNEREVENYERKKQLEIALNNRADRFHLHSLYKTTIKSLQKIISYQRGQREIEEEHEQRKDQIDSFFANLKQKVKNEQDQVQKADESIV